MVSMVFIIIPARIHCLYSINIVMCFYHAHSQLNKLCPEIVMIYRIIHVSTNSLSEKALASLLVAWASLDGALGGDRHTESPCFLQDFIPSSTL